MASLGTLTTHALTWKLVDFVAVKVVFLARLLILARLLTPEDFGLLAIGVAAIALFLNLTDFGIVPALVQRPDVQQRDYDTGWTLIVVRALLLFAAVLLTAPWIADLFGDPRATLIIRVLAIGIVIEALESIRLAGLKRELQFRSLALLNLAHATVTTLVAIVMAFEFGVWALVAGSLAGSLTSTLGSYLAAPYRPRLRWNRTGTRSLLKFGRWIFLTGIIIMLANTGLQAIISRNLGVAELGIFYMAARLAFLPYEAIIGVIEPVAFPVYARVQDNLAKARTVFRTSVLGMATLLIPACLLLVALAPGLVAHVLGPRWAGTTTAIQLLALSSPLGLAGFATTPLLKGLGLPGQVTVYELLKALLTLGLAWLLVSTYGLSGAIAALILAVALSQPVCIHYARRVLDRAFSGLTAPLVMVTACSAAGAGITALVYAGLPGLAGFLLAAGAGGLLTAGLVIAADRMLGYGLLSLLAGNFPALGRILRLGDDNVRDTGAA